MLSSKISFFFSTLLGIIFVVFYYNSNFYPFESINLVYYVESINLVLTGDKVNWKISLYLLGLIFTFIYHLLFYKIKTPIFFKGFITSLIVFIAYLIILMLFFDINRLTYMYIYLIQDLLALFIFYLTVSLIYRRRKVGD